MINGLNDCKTFNPMVERSNRSRPTIHHKGFRRKPFFTSIENGNGMTTIFQHNSIFIVFMSNL